MGLTLSLRVRLFLQKGGRYETKSELCRERQRRHERDVNFQRIRGKERARALADKPDRFPRIPDKRLRLLPGHALEGSASRRRNRTAALSTGRLARVANVHRPRTRRFGVG